MSDFIGRRPDDSVFFQPDEESVVEELELGTVNEYFFIKVTPGTVVLQKVNTKLGPRADGTDLEVAEVEAAGVVVGQKEIPK